jgi:hypothetical protein
MLERSKLVHSGHDADQAERRMRSQGTHQNTGGFSRSAAKAASPVIPNAFAVGATAGDERKMTMNPLNVGPGGSDGGG